MFDTETGRKLKKAPALNRPLTKAEMPCVFPLQTKKLTAEDQELAELALEGKGDIVAQMWSF